MSAIHTIKSVFNGGELSPMLDSRVDSEKYASGCKDLTNFIPSVYGGIKKRPGTELIGFTKNDGEARLHGFKRSTDTSYILEFGGGYLRFWKGGNEPSKVTVEDVEIPQWYSNKTSVKWAARNYAEQDIIDHAGVLYIAKVPHSASSTLVPGSPLGASYWHALDEFFMWNPTSAYVKYQNVFHSATGKSYVCIAPHTGKEPEVAASWSSYWLEVGNYVFYWQSGFAYQAGDTVSYSAVNHVCKTAHVSSLPTTPLTTGGNDVWTMITSHAVGSVVKYGGLYYRCYIAHSPSGSFASDAYRWLQIPEVDAMDGAPYELVSPFLAGEVFDLQFTQLNDVLFIAHPNHHPKKLSRYGERNWVLEDVPFQYAPALDINEDRISVQVQFDGVPPFGNPWRNGVNYFKGDRVHGIGTAATMLGHVFECIADHTSVTASNQPGVTGTLWQGSWKRVDDQPTSGGYKVGDRVIAADIWVTSAYVTNTSAGLVYTCHTAYNPGSTANDEPGHGSAWGSNWNLGTGSTLLSSWGAGVTYTQGAKVRSGKVVYECTRAHTSVRQQYVGDGKGRRWVEGNQPGVSSTWVSYWRISSADSDLSELSFALHATEPVFSVNDIGTIWQLEVGSGGIVEQLETPSATGVANILESKPLFMQGGFTVTTSWAVNAAFVGTISIEESLDGVLWSVVRQFTQVSGKEGNIFYSGDAPATGAWYRLCAFASEATVKVMVKLEANSAVLKLPFKIESFDPASPRKAIGKLIMPGNQLPPEPVVGAATSIFRKPAFSVTAGFPRAVAFHDSRLWWAGTKTHPTRLWASHTEDYYIYLGGSLDTDGLDLTLATTEANAIQWMTSFNRALVIGTSGDEWTVDSGDLDAAMTPTNLRAHRRTRYGSGSLPPQVTGDALLWVRRGGGRLHEFAYVYERDSFSAPDLTLLAEHLLREGVVKQMAFMTCPDPVLWVVNGSSLLGLSYNREHNVTAWHKHRINSGQFISVTSIYGREGVDELWVVVRRGNVCSIERMEPRTLAYHHGGRIEGAFDNVKESCFIDSSRRSIGTYNGSTGKTTFAGYHHLRRISSSGGQMAMLINGEERPVSTSVSLNADGTVTVSGYHGGPMLLGYSYVDATMQSMNLEMMLQDGTSQGRNWRLIRAIPNVWRSRTFNLTTGGSDREVPLLQETTRVLDEIHLSGNFQKQLSWGVKSRNPYPCNLLGVVLKFEVTGG